MYLRFNNNVVALVSYSLYKAIRLPQIVEFVTTRGQDLTGLQTFIGIKLLIQASVK